MDLQKSDGSSESEQQNGEKYTWCFLQLFSIVTFWGSNATSRLETNASSSARLLKLKEILLFWGCGEGVFFA